MCWVTRDGDGSGWVVIDIGDKRCGSRCDAFIVTEAIGVRDVDGDCTTDIGLCERVGGIGFAIDVDVIAFPLVAESA